MADRMPARGSELRPILVLWSTRLSGPFLALVLYWALPTSESLTEAGRVTAAIALLMAVYWMTEALPLPATSLLPLVLFPLAGVLPIREAAAPYANPFIFLFLGGFLIALAIERWNLHRRIALLTVRWVGTQPRRMIGGIMLATAGLSMWISNTATAAMMLPIGLSMIVLFEQQLGAPTSTSREVRATVETFAVCLMLGIAYGASIGGLATLIGTPPNTFLAAYVNEQFGTTIGFGQWMLFAAPLSAFLLLISWLLLTRVLYPVSSQELAGGQRLIAEQLRQLGPMGRAEWSVLTVFMLTATLWVVRVPLTETQLVQEYLPLLTRLDDTIIALIGALLLFLIPVDAAHRTFALDWQAAERIPWGVLLLFGGGLSLAAAVESSGLDRWIGLSLAAINHLPDWLLVIVVTAVVVFLTELTSNTATAAAFLPVLGGIAATDTQASLVLLVPAALAASCAFMLPVATPPNALVFSSPYITVGRMARAGLWLNLLCILLIPLFTYILGLRVLATGP